MLHALPAFLPVAAVLTLTPGVATALVVRRAAGRGRREALLVTAGNSIGVLSSGSACGSRSSGAEVAASKNGGHRRSGPERAAGRNVTLAGCAGGPCHVMPLQGGTK